MTKDAVILILLPIFAVAASLATDAGVILSIALFFGLPAFWVSWRLKSWLKIKKAALFALIVTIFVMILIDYFVILDNGWATPTIFPRIFGIIPIEDLIWVFLATYLIIIFYEYFSDRGKDRLIEKRTYYLIYVSLAASGIFFIAEALVPGTVVIPYAFFVVGVLFFIIPAIIIALRHPKLLRKFSLAAVYFFYVSLMFEIVALKLGQWTFPGEHYVGWVELFGQGMPFEEFFFNFMLGGIGVLAFYELFDDDRK